MKVLNTLLVSMMVAVPFLSVAHAADTGFYAGGKLGVSHVKSKIDGNSFNSDVGSIAVHGGYNYKLGYFGVRAEGEYTYYGEFEEEKTYYSQGVAGANEKFKISGSTLMANLYLDFYPTNNLSIYAMGGIGASLIDYEYKICIYNNTINNKLCAKSDDDKSDFAYQFGVGVGYNLTNNFKMDLGYRYADLGDVSGDGHKIDMKVNSTVFAGLSYKF
ncbi:MAG: outer membrane protein [Succinivibrionaceae bacterium]